MVRITGADAVTAKLSGMISEKMIRNVGAALFAGGQLIEAEAKHMITEGAVSGKYHVASLPGEAPKNDTGILAAYIETTQPAPLKVEVSSNAPYAAALEKGSKRKAGSHARSFAENKKGEAKLGPIKVEFGDSVTLARPYMQPATNRKRKEVLALVRRAVTAATKGPLLLTGPSTPQLLLAPPKA